MNKLYTYRKNAGLRQTEIASAIKVSQNHVSQLERGEVSPSLSLALRIERFTEGQVPASSWVPIEEQTA